MFGYFVTALAGIFWAFRLTVALTYTSGGTLGILPIDFEIDESELNELDVLATLMKNPNENIEKIYYIWNNNLKLRINSSGLN